MVLDSLLTEDELLELDLLDLEQGGAAISFPSFVTRVNPRYRWYPYVERLAAVLESVAAGEIDRLMIFAPPRHGKSELVSRLFSAYYLYRHPARWVGINSYSAELAYTFSRNARDNYTRAGGILRGDAYAVKHWETGKLVKGKLEPAGGGFWAAGVGGPIGGKGFHLGIIDDPIKNAAEAASLAIRDGHWDWYQSTFYSRQEPDAAIVVIQTRWHDDDLSGRLIAAEVDEPEGWTVLHLEAIKGDEPPEYPATMTLLPDDRAPGEALNPARYPLAKLEKMRGKIGPYFFGALYQQRPRPREGGMFKRDWFQIVAEVPKCRDYVRYWDKAGTADAGAYTAGVLMGEAEGTYYVIDVVMGQWEAPDRERIISETLAADAAAYGFVTTYVEQEPGSGGKESARNTIRNNPGYAVMADRPTGDKATRAEPLAAQAGIGNVKLVAGHWNRRYIDIMAAFPKGVVKDPVDGSSGAFIKLVTAAPTAAGDNPFYD